MTRIKEFHQLTSCDVQKLLRAAQISSTELCRFASVTGQTVYNWTRERRIPFAVALALYDRKPFRGAFGTPQRRPMPSPLPTSFQPWIDQARAMVEQGVALPWSPGAKVPVVVVTAPADVPAPAAPATDDLFDPPAYTDTLRLFGHATMQLLETQRTLKAQVASLQAQLTETIQSRSVLEATVTRLERELEDALELATRPAPVVPTLDVLLGQVEEATQLSALVPVPELSFTPEADRHFAALQNQYRQTVLNHLCRFPDLLNAENVSRTLQPVEPTSKVRQAYRQERLWKLRAGREMRVIMERTGERTYTVLGIHKKSERAVFSDAH